MLGHMRMLLLAGACVLGAGCVFWFDPLKRLGPAVVNHFLTDVEAEVRLTDGTMRRQTFRPCREYHFFKPQRGPDYREVLVERLTFRRDGAIIGQYEGARMEALGAFGGVAALDESGLRRLTGEQRCSRLFNATGEELILVVRQQGDRRTSTTLRPCEPMLWTSENPAHPTQTAAGENRPERLTIQSRGAVIHDLDQVAFNNTFDAHLRLRKPMTYAITQAAIVGAEYGAAPARCVAG